jgi:hypothetical protein
MAAQIFSRLTEPISTAILGCGELLMRSLGSLLLLGAIFGAAPSEAHAQASQLRGALLIKWDQEDKFIYQPDPDAPLRYTGRDGREIKPGTMRTDGGSIPRVFWSIKGFSPWGYAPAYVIHDWLFHQHRCKQDSAPNNYTFNEANQIMNDIVEILFRTKKAHRNESARRSIKWAVDTFGAGAWNEPCADDLISAIEMVQRTIRLRPPVTIGRISFSD